ncbi:MAG: hypothetical protein AAGG51_16120 [Cyanobacteria bacterium P01_G01_bin.54]
MGKGKQIFITRSTSPLTNDRIAQNPWKPSPLTDEPTTPPQQILIYSERQGQTQLIRFTTLTAKLPVEALLREQLQQRDRGWRLLLFWLIISICVLGSFTIGGIWLAQRMPERSCQQDLPMRSASEWLYCQETAAAAGDVAAGFAILAETSQWSPTHPLYPKQQERLQVWSQWAFDRAKTALDQGDLNQALLTARRIPPNSPLADTSRNAMATWQTQWQQAEQLEAAFEQAIAAQDWQSALNLTYKIAQSPLVHWRTERTDVLLQRLRYSRAQYPQISSPPVLPTPPASSPQAVPSPVP